MFQFKTVVVEHFPNAQGGSEQNARYEALFDIMAQGHVVEITSEGKERGNIQNAMRKRAEPLGLKVQFRTIRPGADLARVIGKS